MSSARPSVGPWYFRHHAVTRYIERARPGLAFHQALAELVAGAEHARWQRNNDDGTEYWLLRSPARVTLVVRPDVHTEGLPTVVTVMEPKGPPPARHAPKLHHRGRRPRLVRRRTLELYAPDVNDNDDDGAE